MARQLALNEITDADINVYLGTRDDFQFELEVLNLCQRAGFEVAHGGSYEDPLTSKSRQFDVRVHARKDFRGLAMAVEAKSLKVNNPLLVSRVPRASNEQQQDIVGSYQHEHHLMTANTKRVRRIASIYKHGEPVGKAVTQVGRDKGGDWVDGDSDVYDKWAQAFASSLDLVKGAASAAAKYKQRNFWTFIMPVLVVRDKTLWAVDYDLNGIVTNAPRRVDSVELYVGREHIVSVSEPTMAATTLRFMLSHLHIFTFTGFTKRINWLKEYWDWDDMIPMDQGDVYGEVPQ